MAVYDPDACPSGPCYSVASEYALETGRYAFVFEQYPDEPALHATLSEKPSP